MSKPTLSSYIIALLELLEAEGRTLKAQIKNLALSLALISVAAVLLLLGLLFFVASFYLYLAQHFTTPVAALIAGGVIIAASLSLLGWQRWRH